MRISKESFLTEEIGSMQKSFFTYDEMTKEWISKTNFYFVIGDNMDHSVDSRTWGLLPEDHIIGKFLFTLF